RNDTEQMKPRHRAIWSGLFRFGRNLADEGLAILRPSNPRPACHRLRAIGSTLCDSVTSIAPRTLGESGSIPVSTYSGPAPASLPSGGWLLRVRPDLLTLPHS